MNQDRTSLTDYSHNMVDTYYQDMVYTFSMEEVSHALERCLRERAKTAILEDYQLDYCSVAELAERFSIWRTTAHKWINRHANPVERMPSSITTPTPSSPPRLPKVHPSRPQRYLPAPWAQAQVGSRLRGTVPAKER
jgi:hypothetical protein